MASHSRLLLGLAAVIVTAAVACTEHGTLPTAPAGPTTSFANDSLRPDGSVLKPGRILGVGDLLKASVSDDRALLSGYIILLDSTGTVRWRSQTALANGSKHDTLSFSTAGVSVPLGLPLGAVVAVRDSAGKFRYGGATNDFATDSTKATITPVLFAAGIYAPLPSGGTVGSIDYDRALGVVVVSDMVANAVVGIAADSGLFLPWKVSVGSSPGIILTTPGRSGHLITVNGTGTDISSVDFTMTTAQEVGRTAVPASAVIIGSANATAGYSALTGVATCPTSGCASPLAILAMPNGTDSVALARTVPMSTVPAPLDMDILTPAAASISGDSAVDATVSQTDRSTGQTTLAVRTNRSRCATFLSPGVKATPGPLLAAADNGGPVYLVMPGSSLNSTCPKAIRLDWDASGALAFNATAAAAGRTDPSLADGALDVAATPDGSRTAIANASSVIITDAGLRRLGTIAVDSVRRVTFVRGAGPIPLIAVARGTTIDIYETNHFQMVARYPVAKPVAEIVAVVRNGQMDVIAATTEGLGMIVLRTTAPVVSPAWLARYNK